MITLDNLRILSEEYIDENDMFPGCDLADMEYLGESILYPYSMEANMINEGVLGNIKETIKRIIGAIVSLFRTLVTKIGGWIKGFFGKIRNAISRDDEENSESGNGNSGIPKELKDELKSAGFSEKEIEDMTIEDAEDIAAAIAEAMEFDDDLATALKTDDFEDKDDDPRDGESLSEYFERMRHANDAQIDKVAKAVGEQPPKTQEEKTQVMKKAKVALKVVLKGARRNKKRMTESSSGVEITTVNLYGGIPSFNDLDLKLTDYILDKADVGNVGGYGFLLTKKVDTIEDVLEFSNDDDEEEKKAVEKSAKASVSRSIKNVTDNSKELAKCFRLSKDELISSAASGNNSDELGIVKTKDGQIQSKYIKRVVEKFKNKGEAKKRAMQSVDNCKRFAESLQKLCENAESEYKRYEAKITSLAAKCSNDKGDGVLTVVKFQQLKAGIFNKIFIIHVNDARDAIKTMTRQYLGDNPTDLKTKTERAAAKIRARRAAGDIPSYNKK